VSIPIRIIKGLAVRQCITARRNDAGERIKFRNRNQGGWVPSNIVCGGCLFRQMKVNLYLSAIGQCQGIKHLSYTLTIHRTYIGNDMIVQS
jgi:hypothetical protein